MKNLIFLMAALCLMFAVNSCTEALPENPQDCNDWCSALEATDDAGNTLFASHGDCVSLCATCANPSESAGNQAVCVCNWYESYLEALGLDWDDLGIKNKGQCIKAVKNGITDNEVIIITD